MKKLPIILVVITLSYIFIEKYSPANAYVKKVKKYKITKKNNRNTPLAKKTKMPKSDSQSQLLPSIISKTGCDWNKKRKVLVGVKIRSGDIVNGFVGLYKYIDKNNNFRAHILRPRIKGKHIKNVRYKNTYISKIRYKKGTYFGHNVISKLELTFKNNVEEKEDIIRVFGEGKYVIGESEWIEHSLSENEVFYKLCYVFQKGNINSQCTFFRDKDCYNYLKSFTVSTYNLNDTESTNTESTETESTETESTETESTETESTETESTDNFNDCANGPYFSKVDSKLEQRENGLIIKVLWIRNCNTSGGTEYVITEGKNVNDLFDNKVYDRSSDILNTQNPIFDFPKTSYYYVGNLIKAERSNPDMMPPGADPDPVMAPNLTSDEIKDQVRSLGYTISSYGSPHGDSIWYEIGLGNKNITIDSVDIAIEKIKELGIFDSVYKSIDVSYNTRLINY